MRGSSPRMTTSSIQQRWKELRCPRFIHKLSQVNLASARPSTLHASDNDQFFVKQYFHIQVVEKQILHSRTATQSLHITAAIGECHRGRWRTSCEGERLLADISRSSPFLQHVTETSDRLDLNSGLFLRERCPQARHHLLDGVRRDVVIVVVHQNVFDRMPRNQLRGP
jgi:hypothetical protein